MFDHALFHQLLNKHQQRFNESSFIKTEISQRLLDKLSFIKLNPKQIYLEGFDQASLISIQNLFPQATLSDNLNKPSMSYDLILSNCTIQQTTNLLDTLTHWHNRLKPDGIIVFASFGSASLQELKKAWQLIDSMPHINQMLDMHDVGDLLLKAQYENPVMDAEMLNLHYDNLTTLFRDIRELNEPLTDTKMRKSLTGKKRWQQFCHRISQKELRISYEIFYGYAYKGRKTMARKNSEHEALISFGQLQAALKNRAE